MFGVTAVRAIEGLLVPAGASRAELDDAELVAAIQRGDPGSREALYHRYKRRVYALAVRIVGPIDAEEVAQEAFIRIFRGLPKFRGDAALVDLDLPAGGERGAVAPHAGGRARGCRRRASRRPDRRGDRSPGRPPSRCTATRSCARGSSGRWSGCRRLPHGDRAARRRGARARGGRRDPRLPRRAPRSRSCTRRGRACARCWPPTASPPRRCRTDNGMTRWRPT